MSDISVRNITMNNVVSGEKLRDIQSKVLEELSNFLSSTYGPMASNTEIITGNDAKSIKVEYSKDGLKVLKNIIYSQPIEMAIQSEIEEIARYVEHEVGDGTTSSVILSNYIFKGLRELEKNKISSSPAQIIFSFKRVVKAIQDKILSNGHNITLPDIGNICMISTNGNREISEAIHGIYKKYGMNVSIEVGVSNDTNNKIKEYNGLVINQGYSDPAYINNMIEGTSDVYNANIYAFADPIDTPEMVNFLEAIILHNIINPVNENTDFIPTVIFAPKITRDASNLITNLVQMLYQYDTKNIQSQKPPIMIVTNIFGVDEEIYMDIMNLCQARLIRKYIDPKIQESEQAKGNAPTLENIHEWHGYADLVSSDADKTRIINPKCLLDPENKSHQIQIKFLETELNKSIENNQDAATVGSYRKRLRALKSNMIEFLVGGISISDRDQLRDLVEDAVKNCSSAAEHGVGYAANFEGYRACLDLAKIYGKNINAINKILDSYSSGLSINDFDRLEFIETKNLSDENIKFENKVLYVFYDADNSCFRFYVAAQNDGYTIIGTLPEDDFFINGNDLNMALDFDILHIILNAYKQAIDILYSSVVYDENTRREILSLMTDHPFNIRKMFYSNIFKDNDYIKKDNSVLCSIRTDVEILNAISKLITLMVTANQCLIQAPVLNKY